MDCGSRECIVFMQVEDGIASFEREDGSTVCCNVLAVPYGFKEGDVINAIVCIDNNKTHISFFSKNTEEMERRKEVAERLKARLAKRIGRK